MLVFQSCNKQADQVTPSTNAGAQQAIAVPASCEQVTLVAGQHTAVGTVDAAVSNGDLYITYTVTAPGIYLSEIHADIFTSIGQLQAAKKLSGGGAIPGKFAYKQSFTASSHTTTYTVVIPAAAVNALNSDCFNVATHAALSNGETAWGGLTRPTATGVSLDVAKQFPGANWSVYFEFCKSRCNRAVDFTYAWEDLNGSTNDSDYNDLVVQSAITKSAAEMKIDFMLTARGASFGHRFQFKIPMAGITGIFGADSYSDDGTYYYVTVFENDIVSFPNGYANVITGGTCTPFVKKAVTLTLNSSFTYDPAKPYEPFISILYPGSSTSVYDLYIYEVSHRDTWTSTSGKTYPNGILIPSDWRWPLEGINITVPYPDFTSLTDGFTPTWANNLADASKTFDKSICN
ncbi:LruC domain-containing protein [Hymenobacter daeguensis]